MAAKSLQPAELRAVIDAYQQHGRRRRTAAQSLGLPVRTFESRLKVALAAEATGRLAPRAFEVPDLPSVSIDIDQLIAQRQQKFAQKSESKEARTLIPVQMLLAGAGTLVTREIAK